MHYNIVHIVHIFIIDGPEENVFRKSFIHNILFCNFWGANMML